jgi:hypothetical protein
MEIGIPIVALASLYFITSKKRENFTASLPNTNLPDRNYPSTEVMDPSRDISSELSTNNKYNGNVYTEKFFSGLGKKDDSKYKSMTGDEVDLSYFQHNNMMPYFGGKLRTNHDQKDRNESILDNYNGSGSQYVTKVEQSPLFTPQTNLQFVNGSPNQSDFIQSRMNPSMKMSNVKPFADQKVAPGLGLGYGTEGSGGFNSGMMARELWQEKNVDQLRVATNPKASGVNALGYEGPANSYVKMIGENDRIGRFEKNLPDTYYDFTPDRYMTTVGVEKGHNLIPLPMVKDVNRPDTTVEYTGNAGAITGIQKEYVPGEYQPSHNQSLGPVPMTAADITGRGIANTNDYGSQSVKVYANNRSVNEEKHGGTQYYGVAGNGIIAEAFAPLLDWLRPSRKENIIGTLRPYQNVKTSVANTYVYNPNDRPSTTIKETTIDSKYHWNVNMDAKGAYQSTPYQAVEQNRDTTSVYYAGGSEAPSYAQYPRSREAEQNQRNNDVKSSTLHGYTPSGNLDMFNPNMNQRSNQTTESMLLNKREMVPALPVNPDYFQGYVSSDRVNREIYESQIQLERNNGDVLKQLKENPFVLPINGKSSL